MGEGDLESAYAKLRMAYELNPAKDCAAVLVECLCQQGKWEGPSGLISFLSSVITCDAYAASTNKEVCTLEALTVDCLVA